MFLGIFPKNTSGQGIYVATKNLSFAANFGGTVTNIIDKTFSATFCLILYRIVRKSIFR